MCCYWQLSFQEFQCLLSRILGFLDFFFYFFNNHFPSFPSLIYCFCCYFLWYLKLLSSFKRIINPLFPLSCWNNHHFSVSRALAWLKNEYTLTKNKLQSVAQVLPNLIVIFWTLHYTLYSSSCVAPLTFWGAFQGKYGVREYSHELL